MLASSQPGMEAGFMLQRLQGGGLVRGFYLVVSFLVFCPHVKGTLHQQLPQVTQVPLKRQWDSFVVDCDKVAV